MSSPGKMMMYSSPERQVGRGKRKSQFGVAEKLMLRVRHHVFVFYTQIATRSRARIINAIRGPISRLVIYAFQKLQARLLLNPQVHSQFQFTFTSVQVHLLYHQSLFPPDNPPSSVRSAIQPHRQDDGHVGIPQCQRPVEGSYTNRGPQDHHCQLFLQTFPPQVVLRYVNSVPPPRARLPPLLLHFGSQQVQALQP